MILAFSIRDAIYFSENTLSPYSLILFFDLFPGLPFGVLLSYFCVDEQLLHELSVLFFFFFGWVFIFTHLCCYDFVHIFAFFPGDPLV